MQGYNTTDKSKQNKSYLSKMLIFDLFNMSINVYLMVLSALKSK